MAVRQFRGVFGPVTTPFAANGDVDVVGFSQNLSAHGAAGLDGVVVNGSTGEAACWTRGSASASSKPRGEPSARTRP